jgi:hypothetical protein
MVRYLVKVSLASDLARSRCFLVDWSLYLPYRSRRDVVAQQKDPCRSPLIVVVQN